MISLNKKFKKKQTRYKYGKTLKEQRNDEYKDQDTSYLGVRVERAKDKSERNQGSSMTLLMFCLQS